MAGFDKGPILVTGAGGGIGAATVRHLIAAGAEVIAINGTVRVVASTWSSFLPTGNVASSSR